MTRLQLTVQRPDYDTVHVAVHGALDIARAYEFDEEMRRIERTAPGRLVLDLRELEFVDTSGLARLVAVRRRCRRSGRQLVFVRGPQVVQQIFATMPEAEQFDLVSDPAEAFAVT